MGYRSFDFIILGASGFTGQFVLEEAGRIVADKNHLKYAIAGRNKTKLEATLQNATKNTGLDFSNVEIIIVDVNNEDSLVSMAKQGKLIINCVGPYRFYGVKVVEACLKGGADHIDISGEPQYLEQVHLLFSEKAKEENVNIVGACGFDSVPADMGMTFLQDNFNGDVNSVDMVVGMHDESKGSAAINVTTLECALHGYAARKELGAIRKGIYTEKMPRSIYRNQSKSALWWCNEANRWCVNNMASDRAVVMRSEYLNWKSQNKRPVQFNAFFGMSLLNAIGAFFFGIIFLLMALFSFTRSLLLKFPSFFTFGLFSSEGAKREDLKDLKFQLTLIGTGWNNSLECLDEQHPQPPNCVKIAHVTGPDPGYFGTAIILMQCAMTLLEERDRLPSRGGVFTPSFAFHNTTLLDRLRRKGIEFKMDQ